MDTVVDGFWVAVDPAVGLEVVVAAGAVDVGLTYDDVRLGGTVRVCT